MPSEEGERRRGQNQQKRRHSRGGEELHGAVQGGHGLRVGDHGQAQPEGESKFFLAT